MAIVSKEQANGKSIFRHLCDQMHKLSVKAITVDEAKAQAHLAKQANNLMKYELDRAVAVAKFGEDFSDALREIEEA
jgi:formyltetrahydrofolate synthetase